MDKPGGRRGTYRMSEYEDSSSPLTDEGLCSRRIRLWGFESVSITTIEISWDNGWGAYFFIMTYRSAFPRVWPSSLNWKEAAVSVAPDNFWISQSMPFF